MTNTRLYKIWQGILVRCKNPATIGYARYGGRGIEVCDAWDTSKGGSFENFYNDMAEEYDDILTLERKDVNLGYFKDNCEWLTKKEQALNKGRAKNNTSGYTGIYLVIRDGILTVVAMLQNPATGKSVVKTRSLRKRSREAAIEELLEWLEVKRKEFGYKTTHGSN